MPHSEYERRRDQGLIQRTRNLARYFVETRNVGWLLLFLTLAWGLFGYSRMPKAKDPYVPYRAAVATCVWPGASAEKIEQLVTRKIEDKLSESAAVERVDSTSRTGLSIVTVTLSETVSDRDRALDDLRDKLLGLRDLPNGAAPVEFHKDFGDTNALLLTVASPKVSDIEIELRARSIERAITAARNGEPDRATIIVAYPAAMNDAQFRAVAKPAIAWFEALGDRDGRLVSGPGFIGIDLVPNPSHDDATLVQALTQYAAQVMSLSELHPDVWPATVIRDPKQARERLQSIAADRFTYRELDEFSELIMRHLQAVPVVARVLRSGVLPEAIYLDYTQERLHGYGVESSLEDLLSAQNTNLTAGTFDAQGRNVGLEMAGELKDEKAVADLLVPTRGGGSVRLGDVVSVSREYQVPPRFLNYLTARDANGKFIRMRAVTLGLQMRPGSQIEEFERDVDERLRQLGELLPRELILQRTSDQPRQVREGFALLMRTLWEAVALITLTAFIGFWEWRSALVMALVIPITLAMTFGLMHLVGIDLQGVSIASLILSLGLLVDDPVVASDAIKCSLRDGHPPVVAAWLGPTRLATAILFTTITNIAAYLPFIALTGDVGLFIYSLPVVLSCSLVASRIVSMTFVPLLGYAILRAAPPRETRFSRGNRLSHGYRRAIGFCIQHRYLAIAASCVLLVVAAASVPGIRVAFFPTDLSYLSYVNVWLPPDASLSATREKTAEADAIIRATAAEYGKAPRSGKPHDVLESITWYVGGGAPRFWFSVSPEQQQLNYAQLLIQLQHKEDTEPFSRRLQEALSAGIAGAYVDVRLLETGAPIGVPISVRIAGDDIALLRQQAERVKAVFRAEPTADRIRDSWGGLTLSLPLNVDPARANRAGVTNRDVALSSSTAITGRRVSELRDQARQIPIVLRLRSNERSRLSDMLNLYVLPKPGGPRVQLRQVSRFDLAAQSSVILRRNRFRSITVGCFPVAGALPSEVLARVKPKLDALASDVPPGYKLTIGGEQEERQKGFGQLITVLVVSILSIWLALVIQFKSVMKPVLVWLAIPYGVVAALVSIRVMGSAFGFMAFLGIISLIGVIVSHIIVLFDAIEELHVEGVPLTEALLTASVARARPVLVTVAATVAGLVPLALHGGPLWEPLCYAQIGGLACATVVTLVLVPVFYTIAVQDLRWIEWREARVEDTRASSIRRALPLSRTS